MMQFKVLHEEAIEFNGKTYWIESFVEKIWKEEMTKNEMLKMDLAELRAKEQTNDR